MSFRVSIIEAPRAMKLIQDATFRAAWNELHSSCPWATEYQSLPFQMAWFHFFRDRFSPLGIEGRDDAGRLVGLLWLAKDRRNGEVVCAGHAQAEYHGWLARPDVHERFSDAAFSAYCARHDANPLAFKLILPNLPLEWSHQSGRWSHLILHEHEIRPLIHTDRSARSKFEGKRDKGKLNWLKKQGRLEFLRLRSIAELQSCWPTISEQYDRRIANVFGCDPICGEFFFECLRRDPTLVQGFALVLNGTIIAAIIGVRCRDCLVLAVSTFDQSFGAQSPSRLLVPMIADAIWEDGYRYFDLSPFGDWKIGMATKTETVTTLTIHPTYASALMEETKRKIKVLAKGGLSHLGIDYRKVKRNLLHKRRSQA
jgi:CelD/BcsL family acetyltransferase involved in cellulose biosynthesis